MLCLAAIGIHVFITIYNNLYHFITFYSIL